MHEIHAFTPPTDRIDPDHREHSPSTGTDETAEILHAPRAHAVEPDPVDSDHVVAMTRTAPTERYRRTTERGVTI